MRRSRPRPASRAQGPATPARARRGAPPSQRGRAAPASGGSRRRAASTPAPRRSGRARAAPPAGRVRAAPRKQRARESAPRPDGRARSPRAAQRAAGGRRNRLDLPSATLPGGEDHDGDDDHRGGPSRQEQLRARSHLPRGAGSRRGGRTGDPFRRALPNGPARSRRQGRRDDARPLLALEGLPPREGILEAALGHWRRGCAGVHLRSAGASSSRARSMKPLSCSVAAGASGGAGACPGASAGGPGRGASSAGGPASGASWAGGPGRGASAAGGAA